VGDEQWEVEDKDNDSFIRKRRGKVKEHEQKGDDQEEKEDEEEEEEEELPPRLCSLRLRATLIKGQSSRHHLEKADRHREPL